MSRPHVQTCRRRVCRQVREPRQELPLATLDDCLNHELSTVTPATHRGGAPLSEPGALDIRLRQQCIDYGCDHDFGGSRCAIIAFQRHSEAELREGRAEDPFRPGLHEYSATK